MKHHLNNIPDDDEPEQRRIKLNSIEERCDLFKTWAEKNHIRWNQVKMCRSPIGKGFGLYAESIENPLRIEVPMNLAMSKRPIERSETFVCPTEEILSQAEDHIDRETLILSLFLLHEKSKGLRSFWHPYIGILPEKFSTPLLHKENYLENSPVYHLVQMMNHSMNEVFALIKSNEFTEEEFLWAYTTVVSRSFKLDELGTVLIPGADLVNHVSLSHQANLRTAGIDHQTDRFIIVQGEKLIKHGEELSLRYNEFSNAELLMHYGFAIENNSIDSIMIELKFDPDETYEMEMKKNLLFSLDESFAFDHELKLVDDPIISDELMASLRLIVMNCEELESYTVTNIDQLFSSIVNADNERRALNKLLAILNATKESSFTTNLEENRNRLKSNDLNEDERYSLIYLIGQKEIIDRASRWIIDALENIK